MTVAPGMAGRIDAAVSGENRQETPKALRNGPEVEKTCIRACGPTRSSGGGGYSDGGWRLDLLCLSL